MKMIDKIWAKKIMEDVVIPPDVDTVRDQLAVVDSAYDDDYYKAFDDALKDDAEDVQVTKTCVCKDGKCDCKATVSVEEAVKIMEEHEDEVECAECQELCEKSKCHQREDGRYVCETCCEAGKLTEEVTPDVEPDKDTDDDTLTEGLKDWFEDHISLPIALKLFKTCLRAASDNPEVNDMITNLAVDSELGSRLLGSEKLCQAPYYMCGEKVSEMFKQDLLRMKIKDFIKKWIDPKEGDRIQIDSADYGDTFHAALKADDDELESDENDPELAATEDEPLAMDFPEAAERPFDVEFPDPEDIKVED